MKSQGRTLPCSRELDELISRNIAQGKELDIRCDVVFKSLFSKNTPESNGALCWLLGAVTGQKVEKAEVVNGEYYHHVRQYDQYGNPYDGGFQLHFFELEKLNAILRKPVAELSDAEICGIFLKYEGTPEYGDKLNEIYKSREGVRMAKNALNKMSRDWKEWAQQETRHRYETDYMLAQLHQKHPAEKAIKEGHEKGLREGREEAAPNLRKLGVPVQIIAQATGLSEDEIAKL